MSLEVRELSYAYAARPVLREISFRLEPGELVSVLGPNGVGKSTLFRCVLHFLTDYTGVVTVDGVDTRTISQREMARQIAYIPQIHKPTFGYTVLDTVLMGTTRQLGAFSTPKQQQVEQARAALARIGVEELAPRDFTSLSGGEQQMVLVARALAQQARILVMDEPTSALDYGNQLRVLGLVRELAREGYAVLLSTHDPQHALSFSDRVLALAEGRVAALGPSEQVVTAELMRRLYGVEVDFAQAGAGRVLFPKAERVVRT